MEHSIDHFKLIIHDPVARNTQRTQFHPAQFSSKLTRGLIKPGFIGVVEIKLVSFDRFRWPFISNRTDGGTLKGKEGNLVDRQIK